MQTNRSGNEGARSCVITKLLAHCKHDQSSESPAGATHLLVFSRNAYGECPAQRDHMRPEHRLKPSIGDVVLRCEMPGEHRNILPPLTTACNETVTRTSPMRNAGLMPILTTPVFFVGPCGPNSSKPSESAEHLFPIADSCEFRVQTFPACSCIFKTWPLSFPSVCSLSHT